jgi:hypothetical protein
LKKNSKIKESVFILEGKKIRIKHLSVLAIYPKPLKERLGFMKEPAKNP